MKLCNLMLTFALPCLSLGRAAELPLASGEPDFLVPVNPHPMSRQAVYAEQLRSLFKLEPSCMAQMIVMPAFDAEYMVRLSATREDLPAGAIEKFWLTYTVADKSIWGAMPVHNEGRKLKVAVAMTTVEVPEPLAVSIEALWVKMLLRVQYADTYSGGLDGVFFEFASGDRYGETWSPHERQSPLLLVELGQSLIDYCRSSPIDREAAAKKLEIKAALLEQYLEKHPLR